MIFLLIFTAGCVNENQTLGTKPQISEIAFTIPGKTTIYPHMDTSSPEFLEKYGPVNLAPTPRKYAIISFEDPIPNRTDTIEFTFTIYGESHTIPMEKMKFDPEDDDIDSYLGFLDPSDPDTRILLTVGPNNLLIGSINWNNQLLEIKAIQNREFADKTEQPLHITFSYRDAAQRLIPGII